MKKLFFVLLVVTTVQQYCIAQFPATPKLWFKADALNLTDGATVTTWYDSSGNGYNVTQSTFALKPIFKTNGINGKSVIRFDGINDRLTCATFSPAIQSPITIFMVYKILSVPTNQPAYILTGLYNNSNGSPLEFNINYNNNNLWMFDSASLHNGRYSLAVPFQSFIIGNYVFNGNSSEMYENGMQKTAPSTFFSVHLSEFSIGSSPYFAYVNYSINMDVAEIIVFNNAFNTTERQQVETYLQNKWGDMSNPLPVTLNNFSYSVKNNNVNLHWSTSTEQNNDGFFVERKENNKWIKINFVKGNGTTNILQNYNFVDVIKSGKYSYRLKQVDTDGKYFYSEELEVNIGALTHYGLKEAYPNPFNPNTTIEYQLPQKEFVTLKVYDVLGKEIATLVNGEKEVGTHSATFNANQFSSGIYYYRLIAGNYSEMKKMVLLK